MRYLTGIQNCFLMLQTFMIWSAYEFYYYMTNFPDLSLSVHEFAPANPDDFAL